MIELLFVLVVLLVLAGQYVVAWYQFSTRRRRSRCQRLTRASRMPQDGQGG